MEATVNEPDPTLKVDVREQGEIVVIELVGEMDLDSEMAVISTMSQAVSNTNATSMNVDMTRVRFIDSSGLRSLVVGAQFALDRDIIFRLDISREGNVARLLKVSGLEEHFNVAVH